MSTKDQPGDAITYFTGLAHAYSQHRPTYPNAAINWILHGLEPPIRAVDVGCGTGISARLLAAHGASVVGIDPNADMLEQARRDKSMPEIVVDYRSGTGERTGLANACADVIVCAQSFHWFDALRALEEFHRIAKPRGRLALMWNVRDDSDPFTAGYSRVATRAQEDAATRGLVVLEDREADPTPGGYVANVRRHSFPNPQQLDLNGLLGRARSASYSPKNDPLRHEMETELRRLFDLHQRNSLIVLKHNAEVTLADRVD